MTTPKTVTFVGLGVMGFPMAGHLSRAGYTVRVYNRTRARADDWCATYDGTAFDTPREAATGADAVFVCVGNDDDVRSVVLGDDGVIAGLAAGAALVDHTTASAELARELHDAASAARCGFLDAPVSGGQAGAENGALTVMVGGDQATFDRLEPVMRSYAKSVRLMGPAGAGQLTKMVNQICIAGILQGLSEGIHFAEQAGLDVASVVDVISKGAAQSWQMDNRSATMAKGEFDFGFAVNWMRKDLDITLRTGRELEARLPLTALVDQFYADVQSYGGGRWDTSSLVERLRR
ncbi:MAG: oxidoreductase [Gammaproteobacteria bacterium]|nr:oxidoreductase [Gammaproteobacteria bacterium]|tara:strand:+ start:870 stop:1745 length:876 start_codon:yes stop_codon:yes gene_type:complete